MSAKKAKPVSVVAIGGNSILHPGEEPSIQNQWRAAKETCRYLAKIIQSGHQLVISHGNGPQVGNILLRSEICAQQHILPRLPLDICDADTQGAMGYMIQQLLQNELARMNLDTHVITVISRVVVDKSDPAFKNPSKPVGPFYSAEEAKTFHNEQGWAMIEDSGRGYRRVVPSPEPKRILELDAIKTLLDHDYTVIALGGGGIPIVEHEPEIYFGVGAVIDKDAASALLAIRLNAERFLISTAVEKCFLNFNTPQQSEINTMDVATAKKHLADGQFGKGSMAPKVAAAVDFVERTGNEAVITCPEKLVEAMNETAGTVIRA